MCSMSLLIPVHGAVGRCSRHCWSSPNIYFLVLQSKIDFGWASGHQKKNKFPGLFAHRYGRVTKFWPTGPKRRAGCWCPQTFLKRDVAPALCPSLFFPSLLPSGRKYVLGPWGQGQPLKDHGIVSKKALDPWRIQEDPQAWILFSCFVAVCWFCYQRKTFCLAGDLALSYLLPKD